MIDDNMGKGSRRTRTVVHGAWAVERMLSEGRLPLDGRTRLAKALNHLRRELIQAIGGYPSPQQKLLVERIVRKVLVLDTIDRHVEEQGIFTGDGTLIPVLQKAYLGWSNSVRRDLEVLGLRRQVKEITSTDLDRYLNQRAKDGEDEEGS